MMNYDDEQELTPEDIERMKERMKIQKELFDRAKAQLDEIEDEFGQDTGQYKQQAVEDHGLPEICNVRILNYSEKLFKLTETFLPQKEDVEIKNKMDAYNKLKMPHLKQSEHFVESRKREIKKEYKAAKEKAIYHAKNGPIICDKTELNYLINEEISVEQLKEQTHQKYANFDSHIAKIQNKEKPLKILGQRKQKEKEDIPDESAVPPPKKYALSIQPVFIKVDHKSSIVQKVEQNLEEMRMVEQCNLDQTKQRIKSKMSYKILKLNDKIEEIQKTQSQLPEYQKQSLMDVLDEDDKLLLKQTFCAKHHDIMDKRFPTGVLNLSVTERECFEFIHELDQNNFFNIRGWNARDQNNYDAFYSKKVGEIADRPLGRYQDQDADVIENSLFADFLIQAKSDDKEIKEDTIEATQPLKKVEDVPMKKIESSSNSDSDDEDEGLFQKDEDSEKKSESSCCQISEKQPNTIQIQQIELVPEQKQVKNPNQFSIMKPQEFYDNIKRDNWIRDIMIAKRFELLKEKSNSSIVQNASRKVYWGEIKYGDSQEQINKDYVDFKKIESLTPNIKVQPIFAVESALSKDQDKVTPFKTKYGTLNLCGAHQNNFKIDDIKEYEFVQRQRAYLYDPLHIKGSNQLKSFSSQVGFGSFINSQKGKENNIQKSFDRGQAIENLLQDLKKPEDKTSEANNGLTYFERTPAMQQIYKCLGISSTQTKNYFEEDPKILSNYNFKQAEKFAEHKQALLSQNQDSRKQKLINKNQEILNKYSDDFDYLTNKVNIKKLQEHYQKKIDETKPQMGKKNLSNAYQNTTPLSKPKLSGIEEKPQEEDEDEPQKQVDQFSEISQEDENYDTGQCQEAGHAKCILDLSFTKFYWNLDEDLTLFHRPNIQTLFNKQKELQDILNFDNGNDNDNELPVPMKVIDRKTITSKNQKKGRINADEYFNNRYKLSLKDGKYCIFEHVDENPIFVNNFGMVSQLYRYIYSDVKLSKDEFGPNSQNLKVRHIGLSGLQVLKQKHTKLPLLGNIDLNLFQGITVLQNKLYKAPVFYHKPKKTDFFCSFFQDKKGNKQIIVRELQSVYSVGQIEPILPVYNPQSRYYQQYIKQHSKAYIIRFLQENKNNLDFKEIQDLFNYLTDQMLKKFIKEISVEVTREQKCRSTEKLSDETIKNLITPEMICQYESARYGEAMLRMKGIDNITNAEKIPYANNKYCSEQRDPHKQRISKFIENEVLCTHWNLSQTFCTINQSGGMLMIKGVGDPSNGNGGFSFLKMPLKISSDSVIGSTEIRTQLNPAIQNPRMVTGTDADLRKLKKEDIFYKLVNDMGYRREDIQKLSRWDMVGHLRQHSSNIEGGAGGDDPNRRYARGIRYTSKIQRQQYHKEVDKLFKDQMIYLTGRLPLHNDSDYEDPASQLVIPAEQNENKSDNDKDEIFNQSNNRKFIIEISDKDKIKHYQGNEDEDLLPKFGGKKQSGIISNIKDIENYQKLLLANIQMQNQTMQTGQQIGLMNIGGNSNQHENIVNYNNAEIKKLIDEKIENKEMTLKCEVLKKVIRNEDDKTIIERIEFNSDLKVIKKFMKRQQKNNNRKDRGRKQVLREKMYNMQQAAQKFESKQPQLSSNPSIISNQVKINTMVKETPKQVFFDDTQESADQGGKISFNFNDDISNTKIGINLNEQPVISNSRKGGKQKSFQSIGKVSNIDSFLNAQSGQFLKPSKPSRTSRSRKGLSSKKSTSIAQSQIQKQNTLGSGVIKIPQIQPQDIQYNQAMIESSKIMIPFGTDQLSQAANLVTHSDMLMNFSQPLNQSIDLHQSSNMIDINLHDDNDKSITIDQSMNQPENSQIYDATSQDLYSQQLRDDEYVDQNSQRDDPNYNYENEDVSATNISLHMDQELRKSKPSQRRPPASRPRKEAPKQKKEKVRITRQKPIQQNFPIEEKLPQSRRAKLTGESILNQEVIEKIIKECHENDPANIFRYPVDKKVAHGYYDFIKQPICLNDMTHKAKRGEYLSIQMFKDDMALMRQNAEQYNGIQQPISLKARELEQVALLACESELYKHKIAEASEKINFNLFM